MMLRLSAIEWLGVAATVTLLGSFWFPVKAGDHISYERSCLSNMKQLGNGALMYSENNDGHLMLAGNWVDASEPYVKNSSAYNCPLVASEGSSFGYGMNKAFSSANLATLPVPTRTPLFYESSILQKNHSETTSTVPTTGRHDDRNIFAYADFSVRALRPTQ